MGHRTLRRVPLDFNWPLGKVWKGFINPHPEPRACPACKGQCCNPETQVISDDFYDFDRRGTRWCDAITQDEVLALVMNDRLRDFTHTLNPTTHEYEQRTWLTNGFWCPSCMTAVPQLSTEHRSALCTACHVPMLVLPGTDIRLQLPRAEEINRWERRGGLGVHDDLNRWILIETRAKRLGVWGLCPRCHGSGVEKLPRKMKKRLRTWKEFDPPTGPGYQLWETCTEGSPISPVFSTPEQLAEWCEYHATLSGHQMASYDEWLAMFRQTHGVDIGSQLILSKVVRVDHRMTDQKPIRLY